MFRSAAQLPSKISQVRGERKSHVVAEALRVKSRDAREKVLRTPDGCCINNAQECAQRKFQSGEKDFLPVSGPTGEGVPYYPTSGSAISEGVIASDATSRQDHVDHL